MKRLISLTGITASVAVVLLSLGALRERSRAFAAEPSISAQQIPRVLPLEPAEALRSFQLNQGLRIELAACEPNVQSPVAMCFDERGRLFVVEMLDYPERQQKLGRVRLLEDTRNSGVYDKATVYADGLPWPTGITCYDGGVFVAASPDLIYFKDTKGDGVADVRKVAFTGFAAGVERLNVQALPNSLCWGLDNRIHGCASTNGGKLTCPARPNDPPLEVRGRNFSFDPRTLELRAESGGGQYGFCFDASGRPFVCSNSNHIQVIMYDAHYAGRNPLYAMPPATVDIPADGPAAEVYRISPEEAWRVIRTQWRVSGAVKGLIEGGGRASGYFTSATGIYVYDGTALPPEYRGNAFIGEVAGNLVHRKLIRPDGAGLIAERPAGEEKREFLASKDIWFRPVQMCGGPDGALYVIDMYREIIEHPWSLPESMKQLMDLHSGEDRGRIYRIAAEDFKHPPLPNLADASTEQLVATLAHANGWHRITAARMLWQRQDKAALASLEKLLMSSGEPLGRMHALHALDGHGALNESHLLTAMRDDDPIVRAHGVRLAEAMLRGGSASEALWQQLTALAADPAVSVRYQLALTLGESHEARRFAPLARIAQRDAADRWVRAAVLSSLAGGEGATFELLAGDPVARASDGGRDFLKQLAQLIGSGKRADDAAIVRRFLAPVPTGGAEAVLRFAVADALATGLQRGGAQPPSDFAALLTDAATVAGDVKADAAVRAAATALLGWGSYDVSSKLLLSLLEPTEPPELSSAALGALDRLNAKPVAGELVKRFSRLAPRLRSEALSVLLKRPDRAIALLKAIQAGSIRADVLTQAQALVLRSHRDAAVKALAHEVLTPAATQMGGRDDVVKAFEPALQLRGDKAKGHAIYQKLCVSCHRCNGEGSAVGPDFATVKNTGREKMLINILDPNREVAPNYIAYLVETKAGDTYSGLVVGETAASLTVRQSYGVDVTILRPELKRVVSQKISLMPEGLEAGLAPQDLADLLDFIATAEAGK